MLIQTTIGSILRPSFKGKNHIICHFHPPLEGNIQTATLP